MELIDEYVWYQEGPGVRKNQYTSSGVKLLNVANLVEGKIDLSTSNRYISEDEANGRYNHFLVDEGDLIIASSGIQVSYFEKKMGIAEKQHLPLCMNTSTIRFKVLDQNIMDIRYFMYFLKSNLFKNQIRRLITGSAQLNFGPSHLKKIKIEVPELKKQQEIVMKLDKIKRILDIRQKQIKDLNEIIKSQFVEMFGTIKENKKDYPIKTLIEVFELIKDGTHSTPVYTTDKENGVKFLSAKDVSKGRIDWENTKYIPIELHEKLVKRIKPQLNDILLAKNGTTGICAKVNNEEIFDIYVSLALLRPNLENSSDYLVYAINNEETKEQFEKSLKGVGVPNLHLGEIKKVKIIVPPLKIQNQFSEIVKQIDKQKFEIEKSLKEIQELYESLMEKYFG